ncbi:hypothetical protein [Paenibacillus larvae]|uniref:hypothetical protein n=1 Tax=Paenibacillus larvae TaxID=1464 RepID=UPI000BBD47F7|nr:hypothetical protein [Paenibacillus larvae]
MSVWHGTNFKRTEKLTRLLLSAFGITTSDEFIRAFMTFLHTSFTTKTKNSSSRLRLFEYNYNLEESVD